MTGSLLREKIIIRGLKFIRVQYLGDKVLSLTKEEDTNISKIIEEYSDWFSSLFESFTPW